MLYEEIKNKVLETVPKFCPICRDTLTLSSDYMHLFCNNPDCDGKISRKLEIAAKSLGIQNIGPSIASDLVSYLKIQNVFELFTISESDLYNIPRFQSGMARKIYQSIHSVTEVSFAQFIRACQFKRIGDGTADDIAMSFSSIQEFLSSNSKDLANRLGGMSIAVAEQIWDSVEKSKEAVIALSNVIKIVYPEKLSGSNATGKNLICVVTGPLGFGARPEFQETFGKSYGIKWASAVSKNTDILVTNETTPTGKYRKAMEIQASGGKIKILSEEEFLAYIGAEQTTATARINTTAHTVNSLASFDGNIVNL